MKFATVLAAAAAGLVSAAPGTPLVQRSTSGLVARGRSAGATSAPIKRIDNAAAANVTNADISSNWAGAVQIGRGFNMVTGTIVVPEVSGSRDAAASAWVGIDGDTCDTAILQTGVSFYADGSFDAWYEWIPDYSYSFDSFDVNVGDSIRMTVDATSKTKGTAMLENLSTGDKVTHTFTSTPSTLCETNAEWIVEAFQEDGSQVTLADFGTVTFTGASAKGSSGTIGPKGSDIIDISLDGGSSILASSSVGSNTVTVRYV